MTSADWVPGKFGSALDFDGSNDYIDLNPTFFNDFLTTTVEAWGKSSQL